MSTGCYKTLIYPISALENKFDPRNTTGMPVAKFIFRLEPEKTFILVTACRTHVIHGSTFLNLGKSFRESQMHRDEGYRRQLHTLKVSVCSLL